MSNVSEQSDVVAREGKPFTFLRKRGSGTAAEFFPGAGARLRFASNDTDTLALPALPVGTLVKDDVVTVQYKGTTVFRGTVATRVERNGRGTDRVEDVTCEGPWGLMARLVFRQKWKVTTSSGLSDLFASHLVLNQALNGTPQNMTTQVREIASYAASLCGFTYNENGNDIDAGTQQLPPDEARDLTCAAAIMRTLRFFPQTVCRFDYSTATPTFRVSKPPPQPTAASYLASIPKTQRNYTRTAHPVVGVDICTQGWDLVTGDDDTNSTLRALSHQTAGNVNSIDTLHVYMPLARGSTSTTSESLDVETIDASTYTNINFWIQHHPALAGFSTAPSATNKVSFATQGGQNITPNPLPYPRLTSTTVGDLRRFGLNAEVVRMTGTFKLETPDKEESVVLTLDWVCTNATTRTYTRQTGSSSTAGETLPAGLAAAILAQRGGELMAEDVTIRLGDSLPTLGDADVITENNIQQVVYLQNFEVDCYDLTAQLHFGRPAFLSPEDMRDLLLGFRQRAFASNSPNRAEPDADDEMDDQGGVQPITSSSTVVSATKKYTFGESGSATNRVIIDTGESGSQVQVVDSNTKTITLNAHALAAKDKMQVHTLTYTDGSGQQKTIKVLMTEDATIPAAAGPTTSTIAVVTGLSFGWDQSTGQLVATLNKKDVTVIGTPTDATAATANVGLWKQDFVVGSKYDTTTHKFTNKTAESVKTSAASIDMDGHLGDGTIFEAEPHQAEVS